MRVGQSRRHSALESVLNILIGIGVAYSVQLIVFPWFGIFISHTEHIGISLIFTLVSFVRSYLVRRLFNKLHLMEIL